jgi:hypothetical protein
MDIDLPPKEWVSERKKPREPVFGLGRRMRWLTSLEWLR